MKIPKYVKYILDTYHQAGYKAYCVGGCVRDHLLDREPNDYDIATNAPMEVTLSLFDKTIETGVKHGTITILSKEPVEVTVFRTESTYTDHRHPDVVQFVDTIESDLARRDFTINAMAYNEEEGLIDPFGGQKDLKNRCIRCVGMADIRFQEDALRMLRAHRFAAKLGFCIEKGTLEAINRNQDLISYISIERIRKELLEILQYDPFELETMVDLLEPIVPELKACKECEQNSVWHDCDVLHHTLRAISYLEPFDETLAWVLLMHDFGKPETKSTKDGKDHFYKHPIASKEIAMRLCCTLKLTNDQRHLIPLLVEVHDDSVHANLRTIYRYRIQKKFTDEMMQQLFIVKYCDIMAHSKIGQESVHGLRTFIDFYEENKKLRPFALKDLPINGRDVMEHTLKQGKEIQLFLEQCLSECFYNPKLMDREYWISRMGKI